MSDRPAKPRPRRPRPGTTRPPRAATAGARGRAGTEAGRRRKRRARPATLTRRARIRIYVATALMGAALCGIVYKAYGVQVESADKYRQLAQRQHIRSVEIPAPRGDIRDTVGRELAVTAQASSVWANPQAVRDVAGTAEALAKILDLDVRLLEERLASSRHFVWIDRHVDEALAARVRAAGLPGVELIDEPRRYYPQGTMLGPVLGFAGIDGNGLEGIELRMDELLMGRQAEFQAVRDASGSMLMSEEIAEPEPGASIYLTIDQSIQFIAERALVEAVETNQAKGGTILVLDVATSEVLAMANHPSFDPNAPANKGSARNIAVTSAYEIGSIMKVFTVAAALEAGVLRTDEVIDVDKGKIKIGRKVIRDTHEDERLTPLGIIKRSSNVGSIKIAQRVGKERLHAALRQYGFGSETGIELPGERAGILPPGEGWRDIRLATISFGHGLTVTPLQVVAAMAAIGAGGMYHEPRIISRVVDADGRTVHENRPPARRVMSEATARAMWPMLASVFEQGRDGGTARTIRVPGFRAGGKTGTAEKLDPKTGGYSDELHLSSFAGLAPIDAPRIAVLVLIDEPGGGEYYGAKVAGPPFARVISETLRYLGVPPTEAEPQTPGEKVTSLSLPPETEPEPEPERVRPLVDAEGPGWDPDDLGDDGVLIPDFTGMGISRAVEVAGELGIEIALSGSGRARHQEPSPGPAARPVTVRIVFEEPPRAGEASEPERAGEVAE